MQRGMPPTTTEPFINSKAVVSKEARVKETTKTHNETRLLCGDPKTSVKKEEQVLAVEAFQRKTNPASFWQGSVIPSGASFNTLRASATQHNGRGLRKNNPAWSRNLPAALTCNTDMQHTGQAIRDAAEKGGYRSLVESETLNTTRATMPYGCAA
jgi:hypothetical protein